MANLTTKELSAIEDQLAQEEILVKKYKLMSEQCTDPAIKNQMETFSSKHQSHYNKLLSFLN